ncbi:MAG: 50S ribosomal protein L23 [Candidatus Cloacimonetes bacterium]|nr:50S ribosomal protein L23 [Candidatus Cloacimonadota bacterium]MBS3766916.1 50S ribosomal protein L23 [Candidatus Cloacimonadota bacterium]
MSKNPREIIFEPLITEKGTHLKLEDNAYLFAVNKNANKIEIKKAVKQMFNVKIKKVNTIKVKGKPKAMGQYIGIRPDWKKAIVFLEEGESIQELEV